MMIFILSLLFPQPAYPAHMLAPHPLYFTVDGRPTSEFIDFEDGTYEVWWDGLHCGMTYHPDKFRAKVEKWFKTMKSVGNIQIVLSLDGKDEVMTLQNAASIIRKRIQEREDEKRYFTKEIWFYAGMAAWVILAFFILTLLT